MVAACRPSPSWEAMRARGCQPSACDLSCQELPVVACDLSCQEPPAATCGLSYRGPAACGPWIQGPDQQGWRSGAGKPVQMPRFPTGGTRYLHRVARIPLQAGNCQNRRIENHPEWRVGCLRYLRYREPNAFPRGKSPSCVSPMVTPNLNRRCYVPIHSSKRTLNQ